MNTDESDTIIFGYDPIVFLTGNSCCAKKLEKSVVNKTLYKLVACKCISCGTMYPFESLKNQLIGEVIAQLLSPVHDVTNALSGNLHALLDGVEAKANS